MRRTTARAIPAATPCITFMLFSLRMRGLLLARRDDELVERRLGVCLGPEADLACPREGLVHEIQVLLAVEIALNLIPRHLDREGVPLADRHLDPLLGRQLDSFPA